MRRSAQRLIAAPDVGATDCGRQPLRNDSQGSVSEIRIPANDEVAPEALPRPRERPRRFRRLVAGRAQSRVAATPITEGSTPREVKVREGLYRRSLALVDALGAMLMLALVVAWDAGVGFQAWVLAACTSATSWC
jgi:hypothetical protein